MGLTRREVLKGLGAGAVAGMGALYSIPRVFASEKTSNANIIIAAPNASPDFFSKADYVCGGGFHNETFSKALKQAADENKGIVLSDGEFLVEKLIDYPRSNMSFVGQGWKTKLKYVGANTTEDTGILQNQTDIPAVNCAFGNFMMDLGGKVNIIGLRPRSLQKSYTLPIYITNGAPWVLGMQCSGTAKGGEFSGNYFGPIWIDNMGWNFEVRGEGQEAATRNNFFQFISSRNIVYGGIVVNTFADNNYFDYSYTHLAKSGDPKYEPTEDDGPFPVGISFHETGAPLVLDCNDNVVNFLVVEAASDIAMKAAVWFAGLSLRNTVRSLSIRGSYKKVIQNDFPNNPKLTYEVYNAPALTYYRYGMDKTTA
ncbi:MAG: twin-arginine translocation signal domain-containing protein [Dehalococcoidia bacterium]|nr:twin-arginine translocation signal domain-containing protein [Dehalococcoidia bacterium]